ncbi:MAG: CPBP family intramembrane glutamic endopeptidase [Candidatus Limnocylindria bacterium]
MAMALAGPRRRAARDAAWLLAALTAAALARAALNGHSTPSAFAAGGAFGVGLVAIAATIGWRPTMPRPGSLLLGTAGGLLLIALPRFVHPSLPSAIGMRPEPFVLWGLVTLAVVLGEEALLRGALFSALSESAGPLLAVLVTSVAFALMHVPLYGWQVVPLDLGVGIFLAGLRLATGGIAAPTVAHLLADLSTWWL